MSGIIIPERLLPTIKEMRRLAYKKIFEGITYEEEKKLEFGIEQYPKIPLSKTKRGALKAVINLLIMEERGELNEMKEKCKEHGLNYKLIYGVF